MQGWDDVAWPCGRHGPEDAGGLVPPGGAGLVPERRQADHQRLQLLRVHHHLHAGGLPAELEEHLEGRRREKEHVKEDEDNGERTRT